MRLISEHTTVDGRSTAKVYFKDVNEFVVVVKSDSGTHYSSTFRDLNPAEDFAEDWILKNE